MLFWGTIRDRGGEFLIEVVKGIGKTFWIGFKTVSILFAETLALMVTMVFGWIGQIMSPIRAGFQFAWDWIAATFKKWVVAPVLASVQQMMGAISFVTGGLLDDAVKSLADFKASYDEIEPPDWVEGGYAKTAEDDYQKQTDNMNRLVKERWDSITSTVTSAVNDQIAVMRDFLNFVDPSGELVSGYDGLIERAKALGGGIDWEKWRVPKIDKDLRVLAENIEAEQDRIVTAFQYIGTQILATFGENFSTNLQTGFQDGIDALLFGVSNEKDINRAIGDIAKLQDQLKGFDPNISGGARERQDQIFDNLFGQFSGNQIPEKYKRRAMDLYNELLAVVNQSQLPGIQEKLVELRGDLQGMTGLKGRLREFGKSLSDAILDGMREDFTGRLAGILTNSVINLGTSLTSGFMDKLIDKFPSSHTPENQIMADKLLGVEGDPGQWKDDGMMKNTFDEFGMTMSDSIQAGMEKSWISKTWDWVLNPFSSDKMKTDAGTKGGELADSFGVGMKRELGAIATDPVTAITVIVYLKWREDIDSFVKRGIEGLGNMWGALSNNPFKALWDGFTALAEEAWALVKWVGTSIWSGIATVGKGIWSGIKVVANLIWRGIEWAGKAIWSSIETVGKGIWSGIETVATTMWGTIETVGKGMWSGIETLGLGIWSSIEIIGSGIWSGIETIATTMWGTIETLGLGIWSSIEILGSGIWSGIETLGKGMWSSIETFGLGIWSGIEILGSGIWSGIETVGKGIWPGIEWAGKAIWSGIETTGKGIWGGIEASGKGIWSGIKVVANLIWRGIEWAGKAIWSSIETVGKGIWSGIETVATTMWGTIETLGLGIWSSIETLGSGIWSGIETFGLGIWSGIEILGSGIWSGIETIATTMWSSIETLGLGIWSGIETAGKAIWSGIETVGKGIWSGIETVATTMWSGIETLGLGIWSGIEILGSGIWSEIETVATTMWGTIQGLGEGIWSSIETLGKGIWELTEGAADTIYGAATLMWDGIKGMGEAIWSGIKWVGKKIWELTEGDTIYGVSKLMWGGIRGIGEDIWSPIETAGKKIWGGIEGAARLVWDTISGFFNLGNLIPGWLRDFLGIGGGSGDTVPGPDYDVTAPSDPDDPDSEPEVKVRAGGGHQAGLWRVPGARNDPYPTVLHGGERVLTADQANSMDRGMTEVSGGSVKVEVTLVVNGMGDAAIEEMLMRKVPMIEQAVEKGLAKNARFGQVQFDERFVRTRLTN